MSYLKGSVVFKNIVLELDNLDIKIFIVLFIMWKFLFELFDFFKFEFLICNINVINSGVCFKIVRIK